MSFWHIVQFGSCSTHKGMTNFGSYGTFYHRISYCVIVRRRKTKWHFLSQKVPQFHELMRYASFCRNGSIVSQFNLFFTSNSTVAPDVLDGTLKRYLANAGCKEVGADCQIGELVGVDITASNAGGIQLYSNTTYVCYFSNHTCLLCFPGDMRTINFIEYSTWTATFTTALAYSASP